MKPQGSDPAPQQHKGLGTGKGCNLPGWGGDDRGEGLCPILPHGITGWPGRADPAPEKVSGPHVSIHARIPRANSIL